ncbi:phosphotransferase family protein [Photobacterium aphoticum]|uniref:Choline kinase n=1 Tax=Photobacterium aphoticum TaxID=754436 RepID=A0A0J1GQ99_9GAMM|nr:choline kinase [Photobacterium aphoticum]KLV01816.1 choline kinase [Photobacterium aphoticum]PSU58695.1 choline kinase [Photobacterium aphoticum]GHA32685.1 phosphotransferase [Photobacterium aphoticum]
MRSDDLSQMGSARVSKTTFATAPCIHKQHASKVEIGFYQFAAPALHGINTPKLLKATNTDLFIEFIPQAITRKALYSDPQTFEQLAQLHCSPYIPPFDVKTHEWTDSATELALSELNLPQSAQQAVRSIQSRSSCLFKYAGLISGDTNEGNWGKRSNGELVLFDWERFGYGSPAIDLAPLVSGLGTIADYKSIVENYIQYHSTIPKDTLVTHLIIAKCWIMIEVVNILVNRKKPETELYLNWYRQHAPSWLEACASVQKYSR